MQVCCSTHAIRSPPCRFRAKGFAIKCAFDLAYQLSRLAHTCNRLGAASRHLTSCNTNPEGIRIVLSDTITMFMDISHRILILAAIATFFPQSGKAHNHNKLRKRHVISQISLNAMQPMALGATTADRRSRPMSTAPTCPAPTSPSWSARRTNAPRSQDTPTIS